MNYDKSKFIFEGTQGHSGYIFVFNYEDKVFKFHELVNVEYYMQVDDNVSARHLQGWVVFDEYFLSL